jgi:hypothetical protein
MFRALQFLRGIALVAATLLNCEIALAEVDQHSANSMMPACRAFLLPNPPATVLESFDSGRCAGVVEGLLYAASDICLPPNVVSAQSIRVVVKYIDDRPQRQHENFKALALEALRAAWPCKH